MSREGGKLAEHRRFSRFWPYLLLVLAIIPAAWHVLDFEEDIDPEFPVVERPTFSPLPPSAYRLADPGDTLDRIVLYLAGLGVVLSAGGMIASRGGSLWPVGLTLGLAGLWHSATPGPTFDGWHGLGWRTIGEDTAPVELRLLLLLGAITLFAAAAWVLWLRRGSLTAYWKLARSRGIAPIWVMSVVLVLARQLEIPGVEPPGYWPRWCLIWGMLAFDMGLWTALTPRFQSWRRWLVIGPLGVSCWLALVVGGIWVAWLHRPLERFTEIVPKRIYISAMPTRQGLEIAHRRHHFRTIINLFGEDTELRSPLLPDELTFAAEHGIDYIGSPWGASEQESVEFLAHTLSLAQDLNSWPILVHGHGCMDHTPAWMGMYRFVVGGLPLGQAMQEIERHRGCRPKASVTLLYNRVLPEFAPDRYRADPTAAILRQCANGATDLVTHSGKPVAANLEESRRVSRYGESPATELDSDPWADRVRSNTRRLATPKSATQR